MGHLNLEIALSKRKDADAKQLWPKYVSVRDYLQQNYYKWIQAECPYFTDHGEAHVQSVIESASLLLSKQLKSAAKPRLTSLDLYLLLTAILWHDVGNATGRTDHAEKAAEMTDEVKRLAFPDVAVHRLVTEMARAHSGENGLDSARREEDCTGPSQQTHTVYPRALAAIVRFADEISENRLRISGELLDKVPDKSRVYWEYANCIQASRPDPARERVVVSLEIQHDAAVRLFDCPPECRTHADANGKVSLIEYVICRLEKMNCERAYCAPEFSTYASIREIALRFTLLRGTERIPDYELNEVTLGDSGFGSGSYRLIDVFTGFFERYPKWKPEALGETLQT